MAVEETNTSAAEMCSAMAFIISFDDNDNTNKKKLNIKDSIRKFAPPKPDSIEKPRTPKNTSNAGYETNNSPTSSADTSNTKLENRFYQNRNHNPLVSTSLVRSDTNGHLSDSATYLINRMLCSEPTVNDSNDMFVKNAIENSKKDHLSPKVSPEEDKRSPSHSGEKDSGVCDDNRSESGTYTVELDQTNGELDIARKKIDEIFGIYDENKCDFDLLPDIINCKPSTNTIDNSLLTRDISPLNTSVYNSSSLTSPKLLTSYSLNVNNVPQSENTSKLFNATTFTRRKLPFLQKFSFNTEFTNHKTDPKSSYNNDNKALELPDVYSNTAQTRALNNDHISGLTSINSHHSLPHNAAHITSQNHSWNTTNNTSNQSKLNNSFNSQSAPSTPRSPLIARKILQLQSKEKTKTNNRKNSWNHPSSDLNQYESWSLNSDESTDHSSNSELSRNDSHISSCSVPSKMKFNRAFALRRARLGIETPGIPVEIKKNKANITKSNQQKSSYSDNSFSRNDGGRFSLRVSKSNNNNNPNKTPNVTNKLNNQNNNQTKKESKEQVNANKLPVARKLSGLSATKVANVNRSLMKPPQSDSEKYLIGSPRGAPLPPKRQTNALQKSASFADSNNLNKYSDTNARGVSCFQVGKRLVSIKPHQIAQFDNPNRTKSFAPKPDIPVMSSSMISYNSHEPPSIKNCQQQNKSSRELSALDSLVISAINQLSVKLRSNMRELLEKERLKQDIGSEIRVMIDEVLPQVSSPDRRLIDSNDSNISRDLSNSLKNLKKVEQCFEVFSLLMDQSNYVNRRSDKNYRKTGFFVVDV